MKFRNVIAGLMALLIPMWMPSLSWAYVMGSLEQGVRIDTGIVRTIDSALQQRAMQRSIQIQTDFSHCCLAYGEGEIIAYNNGFNDPVAEAIHQWHNSPSHWAIMSDTDFTRIGCGGSFSSSGGFYAVCIFSSNQPSTNPPPPGNPPPPIVNEIPNTSMSP